MDNIIVLGATGNIGRKCLDLLKNNQDYILKGVTLNSNIELLDEYLPYFKDLQYVGIASLDAYIKFKSKYLTRYNVICSFDCSVELVNLLKDCTVFNSLSSSIGFQSSKKAMLNNQDLMLANKESAALFTLEFKKLKENYTGHLYPVDSEHVALLQLIKQLESISICDDSILKYIITASGGALRDIPISDFDKIKIDKVLNHPTWTMSDSITIDCATMVNKAYEILEAYSLFDIPIEKLEAKICRSSKIHACINYRDGTSEKQIVEYKDNSMYDAINFALSKASIKHHIPTDEQLKEINNTQLLDIDNKRYPLYYMLLDLYKAGSDRALYDFEQYNIAEKKKLFNQIYTFKDYQDSLIRYVDKSLNVYSNNKK